jgi:VIT1/CCC1 family predicted Fe2+/Mn2+ transporter
VNVSTLIAMAVGVFIPLITTFVTKEKLPAHIKVLVTLFFSMATALLTSLESTPPKSFSAWEHVLLNFAMTFLSAAAADVIAWIPAGTKKAIEDRTKSFGLG